MLAENKVRQVINDAEHTYDACWDLLLCLLHPEETESVRNAVSTFQSTLAGALQKLNSLFYRLCDEQRHFIGRKGDLNSAWFRRRMKKLKQYKEAVIDAVAVGKQLGDSFAWFFFVNDRSKLLKHYAHEAQFHGAPGIGGAGEYELAKNISVVEGNLYLHHCLTNLLSIGDVTLIYLNDFSVAAVGELKSDEKSPGMLNIRLTYLGKDESKMGLPKSITPTKRIPEK